MEKKNGMLEFMCTKPEYNKPKERVCDKCGKKFVSSPWSNTYSTNKKHSYRYYKPEQWESYDSPGLVSLCNSCAHEELNANNVHMLLY